MTISNKLRKDPSLSLNILYRKPLKRNIDRVKQNSPRNINIRKKKCRKKPCRHAVVVFCTKPIKRSFVESLGFFCGSLCFVPICAHNSLSPYFFPPFFPAGDHKGRRGRRRQLKRGTFIICFRPQRKEKLEDLGDGRRSMMTRF